MMIVWCGAMRMPNNFLPRWNVSVSQARNVNPSDHYVLTSSIYDIFSNMHSLYICELRLLLCSLPTYDVCVWKVLEMY